MIMLCLQIIPCYLYSIKQDSGFTRPCKSRKWFLAKDQYPAEVYNIKEKNFFSIETDADALGIYNNLNQIELKLPGTCQ